MRQQDLVWVHFLFSDLNQEKVRPALVVSNDAYNSANPDVLVCAITSNPESSESKVPIHREDLRKGTLPVFSMARTDKLLSVEKKLIGQSFARLDHTAYDQVARKIEKLVRRA